MINYDVFGSMQLLHQSDWLISKMKLLLHLELNLTDWIFRFLRLNIMEYFELLLISSHLEEFQN